MVRRFPGATTAPQYKTQRFRTVTSAAKGTELAIVKKFYMTANVMPRESE